MNEKTIDFHKQTLIYLCGLEEDYVNKMTDEEVLNEIERLNPYYS